MTEAVDRIRNMTDWLEFLRANPESDFTSIMELQVPMSVQIEVMRKAAEMGVTLVEVVLSALASCGIASEYSA